MSGALFIYIQKQPALIYSRLLDHHSKTTVRPFFDLDIFSISFTHSLYQTVLIWWTLVVTNSIVLPSAYYCPSESDWSPNLRLVCPHVHMLDVDSWGFKLFLHRKQLFKCHYLDTVLSILLRIQNDILLFNTSKYLFNKLFLNLPLLKLLKFGNFNKLTKRLVASTIMTALVVCCFTFLVHHSKLRCMAKLC